jgi:hypothetical protein
MVQFWRTMNVQVNSDKQIAVDTELSTRVEAVLRQALGRFETHPTRLEVHLSDSNSSSKRGLRDKRCLPEARPTKILDGSAKESAGLTRHEKVASKAVEDARLPAGSPEEKKDTPKSKRPAAIAKKTRATSAASSDEASAGSGRSPKKKGIYQARRKAWPAGGRGSAPGRK